MKPGRPVEGFLHIRSEALKGEKKTGNFDHIRQSVDDELTVKNSQNDEKKPVILKEQNLPERKIISKEEFLAILNHSGKGSQHYRNFLKEKVIKDKAQISVEIFSLVKEKLFEDITMYGEKMEKLVETLDIMRDLFHEKSVVGGLDEKEYLDIKMMIIKFIAIRKEFDEGYIFNNKREVSLSLLKNSTKYELTSEEIQILVKFLSIEYKEKGWRKKQKVEVHKVSDYLKEAIIYGDIRVLEEARTEIAEVISADKKSYKDLLDKLNKAELSNEERNRRLKVLNELANVDIEMRRTIFNIEDIEKINEAEKIYDFFEGIYNKKSKITLDAFRLLMDRFFSEKIIGSPAYENMGYKLMSDFFQIIVKLFASESVIDISEDEKMIVREKIRKLIVHKEVNITNEDLFYENNEDISDLILKAKSLDLTEEEIKVFVKTLTLFLKVRIFSKKHIRSYFVSDQLTKVLLQGDINILDIASAEIAEALRSDPKGYESLLEDLYSSQLTNEDRDEKIHKLEKLSTTIAERGALSLTNK